MITSECEKEEAHRQPSQPAAAAACGGFVYRYILDLMSNPKEEHENKKTTSSTRVYTYTRTGIEICSSKQQFSMMYVSYDMHNIVTARTPDFLKEAFNVQRPKQHTHERKL